MRAFVEALDRHQVALYLLAIAAGVVVGVVAPAASAPLSIAINPALALLIFATFLGVPFTRLGAGLRDGRFLAAVLGVNFALVPLVVWALTRPFAAGDSSDTGLLLGILLVLLTPCVDYVLVFTRLAGGQAERLLALTPLLMLAQMALLPVYLWLFLGSEAARIVRPGPFLEAFLLLIALPLLASVLVRWASERSRAVRLFGDTVFDAMVPLMMLTLFLVVTSQIGAVGGAIGALLPAIPVFLAFAAVMVVLGRIVGRAARLDVPRRRALVFTGVTRNSLVVLPLALALPGTGAVAGHSPAAGVGASTAAGSGTIGVTPDTADAALAPLVVVTQTLVELLVMVALVRLVPKLIPENR